MEIQEAIGLKLFFLPSHMRATEHSDQSQDKFSNFDTLYKKKTSFSSPLPTILVMSANSSKFADAGSLGLTVLFTICPILGRNPFLIICVPFAVSNWHVW